MQIKFIFTFIYILLTGAILAIGRIYDERLEFYDINFSVVISTLFLFSTFIISLSLRTIKITSSKLSFYMFLILIVISPLLWLNFGLVQYGLEKYLNFTLLIIPLLVIITEKFNYNNIVQLFDVLFYFIFFLAFLGILVVGSNTERLSVLGGGPIVFARWMIVGIIICFFHKKNNKILSYFLILLFFILALAAGSRGPILSFLITFFIYFIINFQRFILRFISSLIFCLSLFMLTDFSDDILDIGKTDRLVTKDSTSKNVRIKFAQRSLEVTSIYPFGVGIGNWQTYCNKTRPYHLLRHDYPHNIILEVFSELGILGGILLLTLMLKILYFTFVRMIKYSTSKSSLYPLLFYLQLYLIFSSLFSGSINDSRLLFVVFAISLINVPLVKPLKNE